MGAEPAWFFLALTLPKQDKSWLDDFARGVAGLARLSVSSWRVEIRLRDL